MELHAFASALSLLCLAASGAMGIGGGDWPLALGRGAFGADDDDEAYSPAQARANNHKKLHLGAA